MGTRGCGFKSRHSDCCWVERNYHPSLISSGISGSTPEAAIMAPSTNRNRSSPFQGGNGSSSLLGATVAVAEMAMQRIVVPRVETLNAGSNPVGHIYLVMLCYVCVRSG